MLETVNVDTSIVAEGWSVRVESMAITIYDAFHNGQTLTVIVCVTSKNTQPLTCCFWNRILPRRRLMSVCAKYAKKMFCFGLKWDQEDILQAVVKAFILIASYILKYETEGCQPTVVEKDDRRR